MHEISLCELVSSARLGRNGLRCLGRDLLALVRLSSFVLFVAVVVGEACDCYSGCSLEVLVEKSCRIFVMA